MKKSGSASNAKKALKGKRSQPNQGGSSRSKQFSKMASDIQNSHLQYNMINEQQLQTNLLLQQ